MVPIEGRIALHFSNAPIVACSDCHILVITSVFAYLHHTSQLLFATTFYSCPMASTKAKCKRSKGVMASFSLAKRAHKAGNKRGIHATTMQDLNFISDEEMTASRHADAGQKLEMRKMQMDLSTQVKATEDQQREVEKSHTSGLSTSFPIRRRVRH